METQNLKTCPLCDRIYSQESRYVRHVKYCRRAKDQRKGRPKSCAACSAAKVKCTFASPCLRCERKGLKCVYQGGDRQVLGAYQQQEDVVAVAALTWQQDDAVGEAGLARESSDSVGEDAGGQGLETVWLDDGSWMNFPEVENITLNADGGSLAIDQNLNGNIASSVHLTPFTAFPASGANSQPASSSSSSRHESPALAQRIPDQGDDHYQYVLTPASASTDLTHLRHGNPVLKHAASLIVHMACSFPQMMLRRQLFPPFIHPRWHEPELPDNIAACMAIAQLFVARTPETRGFLWRTIFAEVRRMEDELMTASKRDVHSAMQALMIYMLMAVVDRDDETPRRGAKLVNIASGVAFRFRQLCKGEFYSMTEADRPSATWEDWIFAESRRRMTCLWYILSRVIAIDVGIPCEGCPPLENLPLPSARTLWEARTREEWAVEKSAYDTSYPITSMGELSICRGAGRIDSEKASAGYPGVSDEQRLMSWEAGGDRLAVMMNIVTEFN